MQFKWVTAKTWELYPNLSYIPWKTALYLIPSLRAVKGWGSRRMGRWVGILGMIKPSLSSLWPDSTGCRPGFPSPLRISLIHPLPRFLPSLSSWEQQGSHWQGCSLYLRFLFTSSPCCPLTCLCSPSSWTTAFTSFQVVHLFFALLQTTPAPKVSGVRGKGLGVKLRNLYLVVFERWSFMLQKMWFFSHKKIVSHF